MLTCGSGMLDSKMLTEVKYKAQYGLLFFPGVRFAKQAKVNYCPKEAGLNISTIAKIDYIPFILKEAVLNIITKQLFTISL